MHELSIALSILDIAAEESARRGGTAVTAVYARIGPLSGVVPEALASAYELARETSPFPQSQLVIEEVPLVVYCTHCQAERPTEPLRLLCCRQCGRPASKLVSGDEMEITAMEIEELAAADCQPL